MVPENQSINHLKKMDWILNERIIYCLFGWLKELEQFPSQTKIELQLHGWGALSNDIHKGVNSSNKDSSLGSEAKPTILTTAAVVFILTAFYTIDCYTTESFTAGFSASGFSTTSCSTTSSTTTSYPSTGFSFTGFPTTGSITTACSTTSSRFCA